MPLGGSASCSAFDVSTRRVPSLALVPRGHLNHATRAKKKVAGSIQPATKRNGPSHQHDEATDRSEDATGDKSPLPRPAHRQPLGDTLDKAAEEQSAPRQELLGIQQQETKEEDDDKDNDDSELRLGERFLNMMALMARLSTQSLGDDPATSPSRLARSNTERSLGLARSNTERVLSPLATATASLAPQIQQQQSPVISSPKSPRHAVRDVAKRLPRALQGPLTFDICMLLPVPLDERQSPLRSPIRRKRLRKRMRRRRLRRRSRRTWQASRASWPPHASADYIVDHSRQDIAGISAARLVERLSERKVNVQTIPRVFSMPLPPLHRNIKHVHSSNLTKAAADEDAVASESDDQGGDSQGHSVCDVEEEEEVACHDEEDSQNENDSYETSLSSANTAAVATSSPRDHEQVPHKTEAQGSKRPLYHQPAWISPELHVWLVASGLFATKPRRELLSTSL